MDSTPDIHRLVEQNSYVEDIPIRADRITAPYLQETPHLILSVQNSAGLFKKSMSVPTELDRLTPKGIQEAIAALQLESDG